MEVLEALRPYSVETALPHAERWSFDRLYPYVLGRKPLTPEARRQLEALPEPWREQLRRYCETREADRRRRVQDFRRYGEVARRFYAHPAHGRHDVAADARALGQRTPRALGLCAPSARDRGRRAAPVRRRGSRRSGGPSASRGDPDGGESEPPGGRQHNVAGFVLPGAEPAALRSRSAPTGAPPAERGRVPSLAPLADRPAAPSAISPAPITQGPRHGGTDEA
jgi:hypothetical protein